MNFRNGKKTGEGASSDIRLIMSSLAVLLLLAICLFGEHFLPHDPYLVDMGNAFLPPCRDYIFGTDNLGRCVMCRIIAGGKTSVFVALGVVFVVMILGTLIGVIAGFAGGILDNALMKVTLVFQAFPAFVLAIAIGAILGTGIIAGMIALIAVYWTTYARLSRSMILAYKNDNYIKAARLYGASPSAIVFKYVLPNTLGVMAVTAALDVGNVILSMAGLSFIGLGAARPTAEWGAVMNEASAYFQTAPWIIMFNGITLFLAVIVFNLFGDSLRDKLDSKRINK
ncbi:MAG: ABC transporter permease [Butyrivibrio sp.]|nr:ABC transporter permease [Butyrivibrio sp.]